jgi:transposase
VLSVSLKVDKIEYRTVIKFFLKEGLTPNEIHSKFIKVYGFSSPSFSTIKKCAAEFKHGRTILEDDPREGRPKSARTPAVLTCSATGNLQQQDSATTGQTHLLPHQSTVHSCHP